MLQLINFLNFEPMRYQELILVDENSQISNFFGLRKVYKVMSEINDEFTIERLLIMSINYLADLHEKKRLFHGDIKP